MPEETNEELQKSINELIAYRDRLRKEVVSIAQKLRMPKQSIQKTLNEHSELKQLEKVLQQLLIKRDGEDPRPH